MNNCNFNRKFQKNRFFKKPKKINFNFGDSLIFTPKEIRIELVYLSVFKYFLKKILKKKKKSLQVNEKIWYFCKVNFYLQKKSKNSRMGKGKGMLERAVIRIDQNHKIFEFYGFSSFRLKYFLININKKLKLNLKMYINRKKYNLWCYTNKYLDYFDKYLIY